MKKKAFTLAEMLIVIGIIGVVAALVIPSLIANYQNRVLMTQLKKAYAEVSQAGMLAIAQDDAGTFPNTKAYQKRTFLNEYFKKSKDCGTEDYAINECFGFNDKQKCDKGDASCQKREQYKRDVYSSFTHTWPVRCIVAKAGYTLCLSYNEGVLDINGPKGPNAFGKDTFKIGIADDGSLDESYSVDLKRIVENDWSFDN